jgi:hypothetical protein
MKFHLTILFLLSCLVSFGQTSFKDIAVVQNQTGFINGKLKDVQGVFLGKYSRWPATKEQTTIVLPSSKCASATLISSVIYKSSVKEMQKYWLSLVFQGRTSPPVFLDSDAEIIAYVLKTPGAIGVIAAESRKTVDNKYLFLFVE